jgi:hypothetical protein
MPELPPMDEDDEHDDQPPEDLADLGELVATDPTETEDDDLTVVDDVDLGGLELGVTLDANDASHDLDSGELVLDIRDLLNIADETPDPSADEPGFGSQDPDPAGDIDPGDQDGWLEAGDGGIDEPLEDLVSEALPELDDDLSTEETTETDDDLALPEDEPRPPAGPHSWSRTACVAHGEVLSAVTVREGQLVAAAVDILWFRDNAEDATRLAARGSRITDLVLAGPGCDIAVFATGIGTLGRRRRASHAAEALDSWRAAAGVEAKDAATLELAVRPADDWSELWLRAKDRLLVSRDVGTTWERVEVPGPVRAFAVRSDRVVALVSEARGLRLFSTAVDRLAWVPHAPDPDATYVLAGDRPLFIANGAGLWDAERGVACSLDGDRFKRVPGCVGVSAATAGLLDGRPTIWAAVVDEPSESTLLVMIDVDSCSATTIAELAELAGEPSDEPDELRILALAWDADARRLWGSTRAGLYRWEPPH